MRRPADVEFDRFVHDLDKRLRQETKRLRRASMPTPFRRMTRNLKLKAAALVQGGAMALTSLAVIVAIGIAPATLQPAASDDARLARPSSSSTLRLKAMDVKYVDATYEAMGGQALDERHELFIAGITE